MLNYIYLNLSTFKAGERKGSMSRSFLVTVYGDDLPYSSFNLDSSCFHNCIFCPAMLVSRLFEVSTAYVSPGIWQKFHPVCPAAC